MKLLAVLLLICFSGATAAQTLSADRKKQLREYIQGDIAKETDELVKTFLAETKGSEDELRLGVEAIKDMLYNKAYNQYRCVLIHPTSASEINECFVMAIRQMAIYHKLAADYFSTIAKRSRQCEMQTRLFEAEIEFPPYSFLGNAQLFDYARMNECLRQ
jgi:hypothetical protein